MKNISKFTALILALVFALSLASCEQNDSDKKNDTEKQGNKVGDICYTLDFGLLLEEGTVNIKDYRGKVVVINFWGTWCNPCKNELPDFDRVATDMEGDAVIITVHSVNSNEEPVEYVNSNFPSSKMIFARDEQTGGSRDKYYGMLGGDGYYPFTLVIDAEGVITYAESGGLNYESLSSLINDAKSK